MKRGQRIFRIVLTCAVVSAVLASSALADRIQTLRGKVMSGDKAALHELMTEAQQDNKQAQITLAYLYKKGQGVPQSTVVAYAWYRLAAKQNQGDINLTYTLLSSLTMDMTRQEIAAGQALVAAMDKPNNVPRALDEYFAKPAVKEETVTGLTAGQAAALRAEAASGESGDKAALATLLSEARRGNRYAQFSLGLLYENHGNTLLPLDYAQAAQWYRKAAEQGHAWAQENLGYLYTKGQGVPLDEAQATRWHRMAAEQGLAWAQFSLGYSYQLGRGIPQDYGQAAQWYRQAAEQGDALAQSHLGMLHEQGQGVPQDYGQAAQWYREAAQQGKAVAQYSLGRLYHNGHGLAQDDGQAAQWFRQAAQQGNADAQNSLGHLYLSGQGLAQDDEQAARWFREAARRNNADARYNLAVLYRNGQGVPANRVVAYALFNLLAVPGNDADNSRSSLAKDMTKQEIEAGEALSQKMKTPDNLLRALDGYLARQPVEKQ